eukprot:gene4033-14112_t
MYRIVAASVKTSSAYEIKWFNTSSAYEIKYEHRYEPWVLCDRVKAPWHDNLFKGYGLNKIIHLESLNFSNHKFMVHPEAFLIHRAHKSTEVKKMVIAAKMKAKDTSDASREIIGRSRKTRLSRFGDPVAMYAHITKLGEMVRDAMAKGTYTATVDKVRDQMAKGTYIATKDKVRDQMAKGTYIATEDKVRDQMAKGTNIATEDKVRDQMAKGTNIATEDKVRDQMAKGTNIATEDKVRDQMAKGTYIATVDKAVKVCIEELPWWTGRVQKIT